MWKAAFVILHLSLLAVPTLHLTLPLSNPRSHVLGPLGSTDYPWTMFRANALRTGATAASAPATNSLMWSFVTSALLYSSPAVADGMVFISSDAGNVYAIDEYSGTQKWVFATNQYLRSSPAVSNGLVYVTTACPTASPGPFQCTTGSAYALDEQTGTLVWQRLINWPITSSTVVADGRMFYGSLTAGNGHVYARNAATGNGNWTAYLSDMVESSPSVDSGRVFVGQFDGAVVALDETTGAQIWRVVPVGADNVQTALAVGYGMVFASTTTGGLYALNENSGATIWRFSTAGANTTSVALNAGIVYFGTGGGTLYALNATTSALVWSRTLGGGISSSPGLALGSKMLLVGSNDHRMYALDMSTGTVLWRYLTGGNIASSPAVADGRTFFGSQDGKVYALGAIPPTLHASIAANMASLRSGTDSGLTVTVTNGTNLQPGVTLTFASTAGGSFTQALMVSQGVYRSNFTAPVVSSMVGTTIQVTATRAGYLNGVAQITITVNPYPALTVSVASRASTISPGADVVLMVKVTNSSLVISGATLAFSSSAGGGFSGVTDNGDGNYTAVFNAPAQSASPAIITVQASKPDFTTGQGQTTITVAGVPDLTTLKVAGTSFFLILAAVVLIFLIVLIAVVSRRKSPKQYSSQPVGFTYAFGHVSFPGRLI